jgi:hypothetical protein
MFKVLLIAILLIYGIYRITSFMSKVAAHGRDDHRTAPNSNVRIDKDPRQDKKPFKGGDYVDYEEVK